MLIRVDVALATLEGRPEAELSGVRSCLHPLSSRVLGRAVVQGSLALITQARLSESFILEMEVLWREVRQLLQLLPSEQRQGASLPLNES